MGIIPSICPSIHPFRLRVDDHSRGRHLEHDGGAEEQADHDGREGGQEGGGRVESSRARGARAPVHPNIIKYTPAISINITDQKIKEGESTHESAEAALLAALAILAAPLVATLATLAAPLVATENALAASEVAMV